MRGFFEIGVYHPKNTMNLGTLWRSAYQLGASGIFTIGRRWAEQASDTVKAYRHVPLRSFEFWDQFHAALPRDCPVIAVEMGGAPLSRFAHPERGVYLLGAEDYGIPEPILSKCHRRVSLESVRMESFNVSVAGALVMYDRLSKSRVSGITEAACG